MSLEMEALRQALADHESSGDPATDLIGRLHQYRQAISIIIKPVRNEVDPLKPEKGGSEIAFAWRSLQQAKMWLGMALGENEVNPPWAKDGDN